MEKTGVIYILTNPSFPKQSKHLVFLSFLQYCVVLTGGTEDEKNYKKTQYNASCVEKSLNPSMFTTSCNANAEHVRLMADMIICVGALEIRTVTQTFQKVSKYLKKIRNNAGLFKLCVKLWCYKK